MEMIGSELKDFVENVVRIEERWLREEVKRMMVKALVKMSCGDQRLIMTGLKHVRACSKEFEVSAWVQQIDFREIAKSKSSMETPYMEKGIIEGL